MGRFVREEIRQLRVVLQEGPEEVMGKFMRVVTRLKAPEDVITETNGYEGVLEGRGWCRSGAGQIVQGVSDDVRWGAEPKQVAHTTELGDNQRPGGYFVGHVINILASYKTFIYSGVNK
jgi:hypothetical protein